MCRTYTRPQMYNTYSNGGYRATMMAMIKCNYYTSNRIHVSCSCDDDDIDLYNI